MTKTATNKTENQAVVYKIPAAFALMVAVLTLLRRLGRYYATADGFAAVRSACGIAMIVCGLLFAAAIAAAILAKKPLVRTISFYVLAFGALGFVTALLLRLYWTTFLMHIYLLHALSYCLYMVWQLYHAEFFAFSLTTASAGVVFFLLSRGFGANARTIVPVALLLVVLVGVALCAFLASKDAGRIRLGKKRLALFPARFNPLLLYFPCALWAALTVLCLICGPVLAYYCMFAAVGLELLGAVYYTFQLK